ncbi:hypothetical protein WJX73_003553 [Symbiochloris irregularis]|uniref:Uncharacterized protein n=1 Tax=Symbiochloris irregularis TaxID=706552 RepID=A0AAW1NXQ4_9CHLO
MAEVISRAYAVLDTSALTSGSSGSRTGGVSNQGGIDSKRGGAKGNASTNIGGRLDVRRQIEDFNVVASLTDNTVRDYDAAPWLKDALLTADKKISSHLHLGAGYDLGAQNAFATVTGNNTVNGKQVVASGTWFQRGNQVRTEAVVRIDGRSSLWGVHTFNSSSNLLNSTFYNLKERQGFVIRPFYIPVAASAVRYSLHKDGYEIEPAVDLNTQEPYLSVGKQHDKYHFKGSYAFKEQYALLEVGYARQAPVLLGPDTERNLVKEIGYNIGRRHYGSDTPVVKGFVKGPLGTHRVGPLSIGFIFGKSVDV